MSAEHKPPTEAVPGSSECQVCATPNPAHANFCYECGAHLAWTIAERRTITVLFADLSGFTGLSERLDAEQVHSLITVWLDPLCEAVVRWGGHVDKFIGDCVMALFGAPVAYENEPERAVRAALDMQAAFNETSIIDHAAAAGIGGYRPRLSIGVNTGSVVTGAFSSGGAYDYTAIGDTVNVAARLQGKCEPGSILVGASTYEQTRHLFEFGEERVLEVKGRSEAVRAHPVTGVREVRGRVRGFAEAKTPMIGRQPALGLLLEAWTRAAAGERETLLLLGAAGIGKSRLVGELETMEGMAVARGRSYPYASSTPWEPIAELIRDLHDVGIAMSAPEAVVAITSVAAEPWSEDERVGLGAVLGSQASDLQRFEGLPPAERHERMVRAVVRALDEGPRQPTLLVLEDLHWADRTTLDFLRTPPESELGGSFLLVLVSRPPMPSETDLAELIDSFSNNRIELAPLGPAETTEMLQAILGEHDLPKDLLDMIYARSGGNPLFIEEITKALTAGEKITRDAGVWRAGSDNREFTIPDSIDSVITTRIDSLDPSAKKVLQYASIVGRRFWPSVLAEALAQRPVERDVETLMSAALVHAEPDSAIAGDTEYAFEHLLLQEVAYGGLLGGMRAELHGTVADWFESHSTLGGEDYRDWVAYHFERSTQPERALPYLERAIAGASEQGALLDAEGLIDRALAVAQEPADLIRLNSLAEDIATAVGNDERRLAAIDRLEALAMSAGDPSVEAWAIFRRARRLLDIGHLEDARALGETVLEPFRELGNGSAEADVLALLGRVAHLWGSYGEALGHYRAALPLERAGGDRLGEARLLRRLGQAEVDFGRFTGALDYFDQALAIYKQIKNRPGQVMVLADRVYAMRWLGRYEEAEETALGAEELARSCASRGALAAASLSRGVVLAAAGRGDEAKQVLREVVSVAPGLRRPALEAHAWLALSELESGFDARQALKKARWVAAASGFVHIEVLGLTRLAELELEADNLDAADQHSARAVALLEQHGDIQGPDEIVYYVRSRVLAALGRGKEAGTTRERAREIIRETASWIEDEEFRRSFLENVAPNPEIMAPEEAE